MTAGHSDAQRDAFEDLLGAIHLYVPWNYITSQLTTEQREMWADAVDATRGRINADDPDAKLGGVDRWWAE